MTEHGEVLEPIDPLSQAIVDAIMAHGLNDEGHIDYTRLSTSFGYILSDVIGRQKQEIRTQMMQDFCAGLAQEVARVSSQAATIISLRETIQ